MAAVLHCTALHCTVPHDVCHMVSYRTMCITWFVDKRPVSQKSGTPTRSPDEIASWHGRVGRGPPDGAAVALVSGLGLPTGGTGAPVSPEGGWARGTTPIQARDKPPRSDPVAGPLLGGLVCCAGVEDPPGTS